MIMSALIATTIIVEEKLPAFGKSGDLVTTAVASLIFEGSGVGVIDGVATMISVGAVVGEGLGVGVGVAVGVGV